jgi:TonB family protein
MANHTILLIDYEPRSIERFRQPLTAAGYRVEIATDGIAGVEAFTRLNPDMVLVEAMIPKKHGFEVCQELKRTPHGRRTPIIITTGVYKGRKYRTQALHIYGCDEYIEKPIAAEQLLAIVERFLTNTPSASREPVAANVEAAEVSSTVAAESPRAVPESKPNKGPKAVVADLTEDEIMARLDAILPVASPIAAEPAIIEETPEPPIAELAAPAEPEIDPDPFRQMQAELTAELGSLSTALALEPAPILEPVRDPIPSDQAAVPPLLDSLPAEPEPPATEALPAPGQVVSFDVKRSKKHKKSGRKHGEAVATDRIEPVRQPAAAPEPAARAKELGIPSGSLVASALESEKRSRGIPAWAWIVVGAIALVVVYFVFLRGGPSVSERLPDTAPSIARRTPPPPAPVEPVPSPVTTSTPEASLVLNAVGPQPERTAVAAPTAAAAAKPPAKTVDAPARATESRPSPSSLQRPAAPSSSPADSVPAAVEMDQPVAGVETIAAPAAVPAPRPTTQAGSLVDLAEVDSPPASLTRKLPVYSMQARQMRLQGTVVLKVLVNEHGTVEQVVVVNGIAGADLNEAAVKAARQWTYRPATKDGVPVKVWTTEQVTFKI